MKNKKILFVLLLGIIFISTMGATYAYFNLTTSGNENASGITVYDAKLHLTYDGGERITGTDIEPSNTTPIGTKTIEISNDGTESVYYLLHWKELYNELVRQNSSSEDELYITATCTSYTNYGESNQAVSGTCEGFTKDIPTQSTLYTYSSGEVSDTYVIRENISISSGITHVYSVSIYFRNESYSQNYNQNKQFYGSIGVAESEKLINLSTYTWAELKAISNQLAAGTLTTEQLASQYKISVGDTRTATINGEEHTFRLVGINHDVDASDHTIGMTFEQVDLMNTYYKMYTTMSSTDGWKSGNNIYDTINTYTIESDLNSVITSAKKPCVTSVTNSTLTYVTSKLWIMSETEIAGTQTCTKENRVEGTQYAYYQTNNTAAAKIKQKSGSNNAYWLRSVYNYIVTSYASSSKFAYVTTNGGVNFIKSTSDSFGVSVCFCI